MKTAHTPREGVPSAPQLPSRCPRAYAREGTFQALILDSRLPVRCRHLMNVARAGRLLAVLLAFLLSYNGLIARQRIGVSDGRELAEVSQPNLSIPITLAVHDVTLRDVLQQIVVQTSVLMFYEDDLVNIPGISLTVENEPLYSVLDGLLEPHGISYVVTKTGRLVLAKARRAQQETGIVRGRVRTEEGEDLPGANVVVKENRRGAATDIYGRYAIRSLQPGTYTIEFSFIGYETVRKQITIRAGETIELDVKLATSVFKIGEIVVVGNRELLPEAPETRTKITSAEIEHFQATSIGDVLDLVPGIQKSSNPGLSKTSQAAIRGDESNDLSAFGTLVMVDGIPISNNANLQYGKASGSKFGTSDMGRGVDLRTIPADNIESVEITRGAPSVRYGDLISGIINIQTKIGPQPHRLKIKNNPDTREANFGGGSVLGETGITYNFNLAQSERDVRKTGDEYSRLTGMAVFTNNFLQNALTLNNKVYFQKIFDEEEPRGDALKTRNYNRGYSLHYALWGKYNNTEASNFDFNAYVQYQRQNSMKSRLIQSDLRILPSGDTVSIYIGKLETRGHEWTVGGKLEWNKTIMTGDFVHKVLVGGDIQYNANTGEGLLIDTLFNYYGSDSGKLPYSFDDIPGQTLANLFAQDQISGLLGWDFMLTLGARYEMYRPNKFNLKGLWGDGDLVESHQGSFFNPRANLIFYVSRDNQLRLSVGYTSKSPPMSSIYTPPEVYRWRNPVTGGTVYLNVNRRNPDLKGYRERQYEVSFDQRLFNLIGASLSGYYKKRVNEPITQTVPVFVPVTSNSQTTIYYVNETSVYQNLGWTETKGIEFSLKTHRIDAINMDFQISGTYNFIKHSNYGFYFDESPDNSIGQFANYRVQYGNADTLIGFKYPQKGKWSDVILLNYFVRYTVPKLGLWVTLRAEQVVKERYQEYNLEPFDYSLLTATALRQRLWEESMKVKPPKWLFNLNISKSLYKGAEVSIYVNNFLDNPGIWRHQISGDPTDLNDDERNPSLFYGIEFSMSFDNLFK